MHNESTAMLAQGARARPRCHQQVVGVYGSGSGALPGCHKQLGERGRADSVRRVQPGPPTSAHDLRLACGLWHGPRPGFCTPDAGLQQRLCVGHPRRYASGRVGVGIREVRQRDVVAGAAARYPVSSGPVVALQATT
jgi:hypothetical protein